MITAYLLLIPILLVGGKHIVLTQLFLNKLGIGLFFFRSPVSGLRRRLPQGDHQGRVEGPKSQGEDAHRGSGKIHFTHNLPHITKKITIYQVSRWFIHHSVTPTCSSRSSCEASVRAIQNFHMDRRGWSDIGYRWEGNNTRVIFISGRSVSDYLVKKLHLFNALRVKRAVTPQS